MRLQEYIDNFNRLDKPKNFPYALTSDEKIVLLEDIKDKSECAGYMIYLNVHLYEELDGELCIGRKLFCISEIVKINEPDYYLKLEQSIIKTFEKIKFQDTLRNLF